MPPFRPASRASSLVHSCAVPFWCAALPPLLAISRCLLRSIDANPRSSFATLPSTRLKNEPVSELTLRARKNTRAATDVPRTRGKSRRVNELGKVFPYAQLVWRPSDGKTLRPAHNRHVCSDLDVERDRYY